MYLDKNLLDSVVESIHSQLSTSAVNGDGMVTIPGRAGVNQVEDMRKAFYAGARVLMDTIMHNLSSKCSEKENEKLLEDLELDLRDFTAGIILGNNNETIILSDANIESFK